MFPLLDSFEPAGGSLCRYASMERTTCMLLIQVQYKYNRVCESAPALSLARKGLSPSFFLLATWLGVFYFVPIVKKATAEICFMLISVSGTSFNLPLVSLTTVQLRQKNS